MADSVPVRELTVCHYGQKTVTFVTVDGHDHKHRIVSTGPGDHDLIRHGEWVDETEASDE